ncbi:PREDICTED: UPF0481 protein At3g47200-like [Nelumbo nucifera]|nr:PREDICTED: UPF0481 protein At3g47200-like [Nelumbo nucifera]
MQQKISRTPWLLKSSAGRRSCCIFRVPQSLIDVNGKAYQPHIVSIGPYHHGESQLKMIEEHKWRFLGSLLSRTESKGLGLEDYVRTVKSLEEKARECYSETIGLDSDEFVEMMVLDGCFVIELFRIVGRCVQGDHADPIFSMSWVFPFILRDLIRLENQLPFFVLESLFDLSQMPGDESGPSLVKLALEFFNNAVQRPDEIINKYEKLRLQPKHLLDLFRSSFIPESQPEPQKSTSSTQVIQCVKRLRRAGIQFRKVEADSFLDVKFRNGVFKMPTITIDDFMGSFFLNCVAYEQCHRHCSKHITTYATLLDCLIDTPKDVGYLSKHNIIENYFGTDADIADLFNNLGKDVAFDIQRCYLTKLFDDVNTYYDSHWHVYWASLKNTYFNSPWSFISLFAAVVLLLLTMAQTFFNVFAYFYPPHQL